MDREKRRSEEVLVKEILLIVVVVVNQPAGSLRARFRRDKTRLQKREANTTVSLKFGNVFDQTLGICPQIGS